MKSLNRYCTFLLKSETTLLGWKWFRELLLDLSVLNSVVVESPGSGAFLMDKYKDLFREKLGTISGDRATLTLKDDSFPRFLKAWNLPFALKASV